MGKNKNIEQPEQENPQKDTPNSLEVQQQLKEAQEAKDKLEESVADNATTPETKQAEADKIIQESNELLGGLKEETNFKGALQQILSFFKDFFKAMKEIDPSNELTETPLNDNTDSSTNYESGTEYTSDPVSYESYQNADARRLVDSRVNSAYLNKAPERRQNCYIIMQSVLDAGLPPNLGYAMMANAVAESNIQNEKYGDGGNSIGLFQINNVHFRKEPVRTFEKKRLNPATGQIQSTGQMLSLSANERTNPQKNTDYMLHKSVLGKKRGRHIIAAATQGIRDLEAEANCPIMKNYPPTSVAYLTALFCIYHERPSNKYRSAESRILKKAPKIFSHDFIAQA